MIDEGTAGILKIADKHVMTLQSTLDDMAANYPFTEKFIVNMDKNDLRTLDTLTGRFGKLQDLVGSKIIDIYLQSQSQGIEGLSILDKINKLEKLYILDDASIWKDLRDIRNHITHEYPDKPAIAAKHLNNAYELAPKLIAIYQKIAAEIKKSA